MQTNTASATWNDIVEARFIAAASRGTERGYARQPPLLRRDESRLKHDQSDKKNLKRTSGPNRLAVQRKRLTFDPGIGTY